MGANRCRSRPGTGSSRRRGWSGSLRRSAGRTRPSRPSGSRCRCRRAAAGYRERSHRRRSSPDRPGARAGHPHRCAPAGRRTPASGTGTPHVRGRWSPSASGPAARSVPRARLPASARRSPARGSPSRRSAGSSCRRAGRRARWASGSLPCGRLWNIYQLVDNPRQGGSERSRCLEERGRSPMSLRTKILAVMAHPDGRARRGHAGPRRIQGADERVAPGGAVRRRPEQRIRARRRRSERSGDRDARVSPDRPGAVPHAVHARLGTPSGRHADVDRSHPA